MRERPPRSFLLVIGILLLTGFSAHPTFGAAFGIFEQGSKAMGMAGAFTAQADDPSALFHNAGGLAFVEDTQFTAGFTWIHVNGSEFTGLNPFPGTGVTAQMEDLDVPPPHAYYLRPINRKWKFGIGLTSPFGLSTEWQDPDNFPGRYISTKAELQTFDINPTLGVQLTPKLGLGFGVIGRISDVALERRIPFVNPFTSTVVDVGRVDLESDFDTGFGWNVGLLHKVSPYFSWGFSYRGPIEIDYSGDARFTQISTGFPQLDAAVAATIPFDQDLPVETTIEFPDMASLGVAVGLTRNLLVELDVNWTGWSTFDVLPLIFTSQPQLSEEVIEEYEDVYNYRLGFQYTSATGSQWRFGYAFDETPLPEESVGPLLPDGDRDVFSVGYGSASGKLDFALMYLTADERVVTTNRDNFNGIYNTDAWLAGLTLNW